VVARRWQRVAIRLRTKTRSGASTAGLGYAHPSLSKKAIESAVKQFHIYDDDSSGFLDKAECASAMVVRHHVKSADCIIKISMLMCAV
jgi:Ca2+-binding EF-hand superfamily protein